MKLRTEKYYYKIHL